MTIRAFLPGRNGVVPSSCELPAPEQNPRRHIEIEIQIHRISFSKKQRHDPQRSAILTPSGRDARDPRAVSCGDAIRIRWWQDVCRQLRYRRRLFPPTVETQDFASLQDGMLPTDSESSLDGGRRHGLAGLLGDLGLFLVGAVEGDVARRARGTAAGSPRAADCTCSRVRLVAQDLQQAALVGAAVARAGCRSPGSTCRPIRTSGRRASGSRTTG